MSEELRHGILVVDYGSKYSLVLARKIREQGTYSEVWAADDPRLEGFIADQNAPAKGLILSGGTEVLDIENPPKLVGGLLDVEIPILALGSSMQRVARALDGKQSDGGAADYYAGDIRIKGVSDIFSGFGAGSSLSVWRPDSRPLADLPSALRPIAEDANGTCIAYEHTERALYGLFFRPEAEQTEHGMDIVRNFVNHIAGATDDWNMGAFRDRAVEAIRAQVGDGRVICALSGGVDSSVVAALLARAIGEQLTCIFVDTGVMRMNERQKVEAMVHEHFGVELRSVDASARFLGLLAGVDDPEQKRKIIGEQFIRVFEEIAEDIQDVKFLAQGTIYPDIIESVTVRGEGVAVKSHHNVGGLPEKVDFELVEPLRELFKYEVRELGRQLGLAEETVSRHPFPGPGLAVRVLGEVTPERVEAVRAADDIFIRMLQERGLYHATWQAFVVLIPQRTTGVTDGKRTYEWACALRAVDTTDAMSAQPTALPHDFIVEVATAIIEQVPRINRVVYDISPKPPATIEWE